VYLWGLDVLGPDVSLLLETARVGQNHAEEWGEVNRGHRRALGVFQPRFPWDNTVLGRRPRLKPKPGGLSQGRWPKRSLPGSLLSHSDRPIQGFTTGVGGSRE
jgi:hypothetical protein